MHAELVLDGGAIHVVVLARVAVSSRMNLGTRNSDRPLTPAGASGVRASTRWAMLAAMSWSP
jgi:hypothetical protein